MNELLSKYIKIYASDVEKMMKSFYLIYFKSSGAPNYECLVYSYVQNISEFD